MKWLEESRTFYRHDDGREVEVVVRSHSVFGDVYFGYVAVIDGVTLGNAFACDTHDEAMHEGIREVRIYLDARSKPGG